ncbi:S8 family serine peptidase [Delftia tsuruhatensis]|uniref:S8 family serine peptidase n=1 Tax=Delftia tsuruhatensis TaxID=180282 RepID=UPI0020908C90|nr:S8 family serine peptidase [Delftia tsuruhatensis]MCO5335666.1 S8/S53 family peptidase [Delftia tsuruhatensis]MCR4544366.1 S8/S53 family peptidase [Delftia tsuruhatensis]
MDKHIAYLVAALSTARAVQQADYGRLPPDELRFVMELKPGEQVAAALARLQQLLPAGRFLVEALDAGSHSAGRFHVLRFPTLERVFPQHQAFDIAYALADMLGLQSCEPDLGADVYLDPAPPTGGPNVESSLLGGLCWADGDPPPDKRWALKHTRLDVAHQYSRGKGILVGQPDTGITGHAELGGDMFDMSRATNLVEGNAHPKDPLAPGMASPGHGTSTSSVLASRGDGHITGAAPEATVVPIRCIDSVKVFNTAPVAAAIAHAVRSGCHVISMSLGGLAGRALHAALKDAVAHDLIVVAASGNCVGMVVWPARYPEVIAAGGVGPGGKAWKGTSRGSRITVSAPAEFVWRAERTKPNADPALVSASQGTSYATALIAGAAAVWLSRHGRDTVIAEARRRGVTVARLFTTALKQTANTPDGWDADLGAGMLDADKLVNLPLGSIQAVEAEAAAQGEDDWVEEMLLEQFGAAARDPAFDTTRFGAELSAIALSQARFDQQLQGLTPEAKSEGTRPSSRLAQAVHTSLDSRLGRFGQSVQSSVSRPTLPMPAAADARRTAVLLPAGTIAESAAPGETMEAARTFLGGDAGKKLLEDTSRFIDGSKAPEPDKRAINESVRKLLQEIGQGGAIRSPEARLGLEALIEMKGRPALRVRNGDVDDNDPRAEQWGFPIYNLKANAQFSARVGAVGRIDMDGVHVGTGWMVGDELVLTNRHVLQGVAYPTPTRDNPARWVMKDGNCTIDFSEEPTGQTQATRFDILSVEEAGPRHIDVYLIDFRKPDFALLRVKGTSLAGAKGLPQPLELFRADGALDPGRDMVVVGYPARMSTKPRTEGGEIDLEGMERLQALFAADYGTKYFSPGVVKTSPAMRQQFPDTASHDATTLAGNSGSLIASIHAPMKAVGLHFAGAWRKENYAHSLGGLWSLGYLRHPGINWVG